MIRTRTTTRLLAISILAMALWPAAAGAFEIPKRISSVSFSGASKGYIAGGINDGFVSWTENGGATWRSTIMPKRYMVGVSATPGGGPVTALTTAYDVMYKSTNGGVDWTAESPILSQSAVFQDLAYLAGGRRVAVGKLQPSDQYALIASSVNSQPWRVDFRGPIYPPDPVTGLQATYAALSAIDAAPGGNVAWAVGSDWTKTGLKGPYDGLIRKTADGGSSWTTQTAPAKTPGLKCVAAVDATTAFIGQQSRILLRTVDGEKWTQITSVPSASGITAVNAIDALDADHVLIVGNNGRMAWTKNASAATPTWVYTTTATTNMLLGAQMLDAKNWIVVGDNETILKTDDAGATWSGSKVAQAPSITRDAPTSTSSLDRATISVRGTSSDGIGVGVGLVQVRLHNKDGKYWNGKGWVTSDTWVSAERVDPANGWDSWKKTISLPSAPAAGTLTMWVRATDGVEQQKTLALGKEKVTTPVVPSYVKHSKSFKVTSQLYPRQTGAKMKFTFKRYEKGRWVTRKTTTVTVANYNLWSRGSTPSVKLAAGKWTVQSKHTNSNGKSYTASKSFTIR